MVRKALESDLPALAAIEAECIAEPWSLRSFEREFAANGAIFLVAEGENGRICGFLTASSVLDEVSINNVAVSALYRRNGIAQLLMGKLWEYTEEFAAFITLEVRESNLPAISLYEKLGYERVGLRKNFYSSPVENALLMTKFNRR